jgi:hypothetical protein
MAKPTFTLTPGGAFEFSNGHVKVSGTAAVNPVEQAITVETATIETPGHTVEVLGPGPADDIALPPQLAAHIFDLLP